MFSVSHYLSLLTCDLSLATCHVSFVTSNESASKQATRSAAASIAGSAGTGAVKRRPAATNGWNRLLHAILLRLSRQLGVRSPHLPTSGKTV